MTVTNDAYRIEASVDGQQVQTRLTDTAMGFDLADGPYVYRAVRKCPEGSIVSEWLGAPRVSVDGQSLVITGSLAGLDVAHTFHLPSDRPIMEERIILRNGSGNPVSLSDLRSGFSRRIADHYGNVLPRLRSDRLAAIPFRHRATDPAEGGIQFAQVEAPSRGA